MSLPLLQEVAVNSLLRASSQFLIAGLICAVAGCADVVTYSKDSRNEGLRLMRAQEYADAAGAFRNATRQNPRDYQSYFYLGEAYAIAGKDDLEFRQTVLNGYASAIARSDTRDIETNAAIQNAHNSAKASDWFLVAKIYAFRADPDNAIDAYTRAEQIDPTNFYIAKDRGLYLEKRNQQAKAEPSLRRAYAINQDDEEVSAALRRLGIVPGLSLKSENTLANPPLPKGPIPQPKFLQRTDQTAETPRD
jgi:tetratricopeptide (TPR) repeat protein